VSERLKSLSQASAAFISMLDADIIKLNAFFKAETDRLQTDYQDLKQNATDQGYDGLLQSVLRLEQFVFLNFTGICKILKKHDKISGLRLSEPFLSRLMDLDFYRSTGLSTLKVELLNIVSGIPSKSETEADGEVLAGIGSMGMDSPHLGSGVVHTPNEATSFPTSKDSQWWFPPASLLPSQKIVISMQGPHGTDIIGSLLDTISAYDVLVEDVMMSRLYHNVACAIRVKILTEDPQLFKDLADGAAKWEAELKFEVYDDKESLPHALDEAPYANRAKYVATMVNENGLSARFLSAWTKLLLVRKISVESLKRLNDGSFCVLEMKLSVPMETDLEAFRTELFQLSSSSGTDVSLQPDDIYRRSKRLVVLDMDSTLIRQEVIDELARHAGVVSEVAKITHRAMNGEIDFKESLRQRVGLLKGSPVDILEKVRQSLVFTDGARFLCRALKRLGYKLGKLWID
jgi:hypothetical protein